MKQANDVVKWIAGMGLVIIALWLLAQFVTDYSRASADLNAAGIVDHHH